MAARAKRPARAKSGAGAKKRKRSSSAAKSSAKRSSARRAAKKAAKKAPKRTAKKSAKTKKRVKTKARAKTSVKTKAKRKRAAAPKAPARRKERPQKPSATKPARRAKKPLPGPVRARPAAKAARSAATLPAAGRAALLKRPLPRPILPDLADLESIVAHASEDSSERLVSEATKFDIGIAHNGMAMPQAELPSEYGKDRVMLLVVDPSFVFTYWEVTNDSLNRASEAVGPSGKLTLRFYDMNGGDSARGGHHWDVEIFDRMGNWYLRLAHPEQRICLDIGMKNASGQFFAITRSNVMRLPPQGLAKPGPIKWMVVTPSGEKLISDVEEYTDADLDLLKRILGPYFYDLLMRGRLASITGSSMEAIFYDVSNLSQPPGQSPAGASWSQARQ